MYFKHINNFFSHDVHIEQLLHKNMLTDAIFIASLQWAHRHTPNISENKKKQQHLIAFILCTVLEINDVRYDAVKFKMQCYLPSTQKLIWTQF